MGVPRFQNNRARRRLPSGGSCKCPVEHGLRRSYIARTMLRRFLTAFLALFALGALADSAAAKPFPSLAKRPSETRDRTPPVPQAVVPAAADPQLVAQVEGLAKQAESGEAAFRTQLDTGRVMADLAAIDPVRSRALAMVDAQNDALDGLRRGLKQP